MAASGSRSRRRPRPGARLREGDAVALGQRLEAGLGPVADAALRHVDDPPQRHGVLGVDQHPQVGQRVADLAALVEPHPADHLVRKADPDEHLLEDPGLRVGPVEHRDLRRAHRLRVGEPVDLLGDEGRLVVLVVGDVADLLCPGPRRTRGSSPCGSRFALITAFAAVRIVWVER